MDGSRNVGEMRAREQRGRDTAETASEGRGWLRFVAGLTRTGSACPRGDSYLDDEPLPDGLPIMSTMPYRCRNRRIRAPSTLE